MSRTTLDLDDDVLRRLRERREAESRPMGEIASELLARALDDSGEAPVAFTWRSAPMGRALVDIEDKDALWAVLDGRQ